MRIRYEFSFFNLKKVNRSIYLSFSISFILLHCFIVTASAILENNEILTVLCHFICAHGPKLRLRNIDDRAANLYETSASIFH